MLFQVEITDLGRMQFIFDIFGTPEFATFGGEIEVCAVFGSAK